MRYSLILGILAFAVGEPSSRAAPPQERAPIRDGTSAAGERESPEGQVRTIIVSTGTRTERDAATTPIATDVVTREEIVNSGAENVAEALEESGASIQTSTSFNGTSLALRGLNAEQILILIDGQRVTGRVGGGIDLRRLTVENVENIELVYGAGSVLHGSDALGGVVNIITRKPDPGLQGELHGTFGSRMTADASARIAGGWKRVGLYATGGYHRTDGWDADRSDVATTGDAWEQFNVGAGARIQPSSRFRVDMSGDYMQRDSNGIDGTNAGAILDRRNLTETVNATISPQWIGRDNRLRLNLHYNDFRDQFRQDQRGDVELDKYEPTRDQLAQLGLQLDQSAGAHVVTTGLDAQLEWLETTRILADGSKPAADRQRAAIFIQDEWTPHQLPRVVVLPALRLDYDTQFGLYPTGRLALMVAPRDDLTLRVSYGRGYRAPSFRELYLAFANPGVGYRVAGNPNLQPEQAWTLDIGATWAPSDRLSLRASIFDNQLRDLMTVDLVNQSGVDGLDTFTYINVGAGFSRGVETGATFKVLPDVELASSYTLLHARTLDTDEPLPGRSPHQGTVALRFHRPKWGTRLTIRGRVQGKRPFSSADGSPEYADPFATVDARISQTMLRYCTAFVGVDNMLNAGDSRLLLMPPRSFYAGITLRY